MLSIPATGSVDDHGLLVHEDDPAAQLALSLHRVESALADAGHEMCELTAIRALTIDRPALEQVFDVLTERLDAIGASPVTSIHDVPHLPVVGMVVALEADVDGLTPTELGTQR
ncbi:MAG: Rid family hydrolase [Actinomycetota bacterium]|nr:Rid family hydrolase [Actinomycetota bacterium]